jgi:hypothetical protein
MTSTSWSTSCLVVLPRCAQSTVWHHHVGSPGTVAMPCEWSTGPAWYCSFMISAGPHVLQALNVPPACTSCRLMMALTLGVLVTCVRDSKTRESSYIGSSARFFFMLETRGPQGTVGCVAALELSRQGGRVRSYRTYGGTGALPNREAGSGATDTWQHRSPAW